MSAGRSQMVLRSEPDSPSLGPTSASGSPSCFYLTDHSPPSSLQSNASYLNLYASQLQGNTPRMMRANSTLFREPHISRTNSLSNSIGGKSPEFSPVSSTMPSMTPLNLSISTSGTISPELEDKNGNFRDDLGTDEPKFSGGSDGNDDDDDVFGENISNPRP
ncbi:hypothetical protein FOA43_003384 [Brettanomyces nanus]|uniref:Uncharacterized protein n=1 Tax=Eeniella nana TaxID=13502 RepID=A0A875S4W5_EENNA|nr:uncharacterized protein FOA43_003384 [Brettanomyces nanus]QPG75998.1 hypothetical protein FOA43_003384 [Brettanomyces nanus]